MIHAVIILNFERELADDAEQRLRRRGKHHD